MSRERRESMLVSASFRPSIVMAPPEGMIKRISASARQGGHGQHRLVAQPPMSRQTHIDCSSRTRSRQRYQLSPQVLSEARGRAERPARLPNTLPRTRRTAARKKGLVRFEPKREQTHLDGPVVRPTRWWILLFRILFFPRNFGAVLHDALDRVEGEFVAVDGTDDVEDS